MLALPLADAGPDLTIIGFGEVTLGGSPSGPAGSSFIWTPDSLLNAPTVPNPTTAPLETAWYTLTVTAPNGCIDTDSVLVTIVPEMIIPSGFTPNGDGWNDGWQIDLIGMFPECEVEMIRGANCSSAVWATRCRGTAVTVVAWSLWVLTTTQSSSTIRNSRKDTLVRSP